MGRNKRVRPSQAELGIDVSSMSAENLCKNLSKYRKEARLSQGDVASALGVSVQAVSKWERGICCPDVALLPSIAAVFCVDINALFEQFNTSV